MFCLPRLQRRTLRCFFLLCTMFCRALRLSSVPLLQHRASSFLRSRSTPIGAGSYGSRQTHINPYTFRFAPVSLSSSSSSSQTKEGHTKSDMQPLVEVEQKFQLLQNNDGIEEQLRNLNFVSKGTTQFVDWYFDTKDIALSIQNCWLRYRETVDGSTGIWQLKRGNSQSYTFNAATVYEEIEGDVAVTECFKMLSVKEEEEEDPSSIRNEQLEHDELAVGNYNGHMIPKLPEDIPQGLFGPFCRIVTTRSSWTYNGPDDDTYSTSFNGLVVDLDATDTGHAVGEVETLVEQDGNVPEAKRRIQALIEQLTAANEKNPDTNGDSPPPMGKLEHYLWHHRPDHYKACVESGSMVSKS